MDCGHLNRARFIARLSTALISLALLCGSVIFPIFPTAIAESIDYASQIRPLVERYCGDCHSGDDPSGGIAFEKLDVGRSATKDRQLWQRVLSQLDNSAMPPADSAQPSESERQLILSWLRNQALLVDCSAPRFAGRVTLRRLNRDEYNRTIRDLVGINYRPADDFPSDDVGYGFDNIGDVLSLPPVLMERYVNAAEEVTRRAIVVAEPDFAQVQSAAGKFLASQDEASGTFEIPVSANYIFRVHAYGDQAGPDAAMMELFVGKKSVKKFSVPDKADSPGRFETTVRVARGKRQLSVRFLNDYYQPEHADPELRGDRNLNVLAIELVGPIGTLPENLPDSHHRLIRHTPKADAKLEEVLDAVQENLKQIIPRALRRPTTKAEIDKYSQIARMVLEDGGSFERAMQVVVQAVLVSPHFLFRVERDPSQEQPVQRELSDYELASRLSYFLWSSMPDDPLFFCASGKKLKAPDELRKQVRRMLKEEKSRALVDNFATQWLQLRKLETVSVDTQRFVEFTPELRAAMRQETELLFGSVLREDRSIFDLLSADFTYVNEPLATLYGISDVSGQQMRRIELADQNRRGLLGQASILTVTSNPTRTSPVKRGKWILENLLAAPPPPAPPNVPELEPTQSQAGELRSLREQMELHRSKPGCAGCHQLMDPLGFGLENFDAIGRWRDEDSGRVLDSSGQLPDGRVFKGPAELRDILLQKKSEFRRCLASKLLTYALGRGLEYFDECTLNEICANTESGGDTLAKLIEEIVLSHPFRWRSRLAMPE